MNGDKKIPFGIDLGTTNSAISVGLESGFSQIITLSNGKRTMPSVVKYLGSEVGEELSLKDSDVVLYEEQYYLVGQRAYDTNIDGSIITSVKRHMQETEYNIILEKDGEKTELTAVEISALILMGLIKQTNAMYGKIEDVVITVPAYFNQIGVSNTKEACEIAGLNCLSILREPTAAALNYNLGSSGISTEYAIVYDLGGGTFDVSLVRISERNDVKELAELYGIKLKDDGNSTGKIIEPQYIDGDGQLGGDDYDLELYKILVKKMEKWAADTNIEISEEYITHNSKRRLIRIMQQAKTNLSGAHRLNVVCELNNGTEYKIPITFELEDFARAFVPIYKRTSEKLNNVLANANCPVDTIILMGGSTKNPLITQMLTADYPGFTINSSLDPDESVATGAGIKAINYKYGDSNVQIFDVLPQSIGILEGGKVKPLIMRNSQLPVSVKKYLTTITDNQTQMRLKIYQGNSSFPEECTVLGDLVMRDIKPAPKGNPILGAVLSINTESLLTCKAIIDGRTEEVILDLNKVETVSTAKVERIVLRWKRVAESLDSKNRDILINMIMEYPEKRSKEEIASFIRKHK